MDRSPDNPGRGGDIPPHSGTGAAAQTVDAAARSPAPPPRVRGYEVVGWLGEGGMGTVWRAMQLGTGREVALKVMRDDGAGLSHSPAARLRFEREVRLAAALEHPNIARVYDGGLDEGVYFYAMERVDGDHLDRYVRAKGLSLREMLHLMCGVCDGMAFAHAKGVVHRDLKPGNILIGSDGRPRVADFGLARIVRRGRDDEEASADLTQPGAVAGTPAFMSPEQGGDTAAADARSDVYSLGVILFDLLTGNLPAAPVTPASPGPAPWPPWPSRARQEIDPDLRAVVDKALSTARADRYPTAAELGADLRNYLEGRPVTARRRPRVESARRSLVRHGPVLAGTSVAAVILAVVLALAGTWALPALWHKASSHGPGGPGSAPVPEATAPPVPLPARLQGLAAVEALRVAYQEAPPAPPAGTARPQLRLGIVCRRGGVGPFVPLGDGESLASATDEYILLARAPAGGYLYIFQVDSTGKAQWLFPQNSACQFSSGSSPLAPGQRAQAPAQPGHVLTLDETAGVEHVYFVLSASRWPRLEEALSRQPSLSRGAEIALRGGHPAEALPPAVTEPNALGLRGAATRGVGANRPATGRTDDFEALAVEVLQDGKPLSVAVPAAGVDDADAEGSFVVAERWFRHTRGG